MPYVFHTKTPQSMLDPVGRQVARLIALHNEAEHGGIIPDVSGPITALSAAGENLVVVAKQTYATSKDEELKRDMPLAIESVQSAIAMLNEAARGLSTGEVLSDEDRKKLLDGSNGILNSVSLLLHVFDRSEVRKILKICNAIMEYLQVAEIVQTIDELVTFTKNLTPGSESLKKQVDSRSEELTNPSLAATLKDEAKKFKMQVSTLLSAIKTVVDLRKSRSEGLKDAEDNRNLAVISLSNTIEEIIRVLQLTSSSEELIDTHPHVPSSDAESTDLKSQATGDTKDSNEQQKMSSAQNNNEGDSPNQSKDSSSSDSEKQEKTMPELKQTSISTASDEALGQSQKCDVCLSQAQLDEKPNLHDVFKLTKSHSIHWNALGRELKVDFNFREQEQRKSKDDDDRLEAVLNKWIESESAPVTWSSLIIALQAIELVNVANNVKDFLRARK